MNKYGRQNVKSAILYHTIPGFYDPEEEALKKKKHTHIKENTGERDETLMKYLSLFHNL